MIGLLLNYWFKFFLMDITTDASIYEIKPKKVIYPKNRDNLIGSIRNLLLSKQSFTMRAGGTSIGGQAIGHGVLVDVSKHLTNIVNFQENKREVIVDSGVIQDDLNSFLKPYNLKFAPDTSTSNRAMIGGMIGNNSCGSYSIFYGTTRDHVKSVEVILSDGSLVEFKELTKKELDDKLSLQTLEGSIYRFIINLLNNNQQEILDAFPDKTLIRRNTGYALDELIRKHKPFNLIDGKGFNLTSLICGSEGTLGVIVSAKLSLVGIPKYKGLMTAHFSSSGQSLKLIKDIVKLNPAAIEYIDKPTLDASKDNSEQQKNRVWINGDPKSILIIEFYAESSEELSSNICKCETVLLFRGAYSVELINKNDVNKVWEIRKAGLGLLMGKAGPKKPVPIIEDAAVPVSNLYMYYKEIRALMKFYNVNAVYYGHASVGLIHIRPELNLSDKKDKNIMRSIAKDVSKIVKKYKGALSGEHGDGRVRAPFLKEQFGNTVYQYLVDLKNIFDPENLFNPGVILSDIDLLKNLRLVVSKRDVNTAFDWGSDISFFHAAEKCNGAGVCRKSSSGAMCPSYRVTRNEEFSTRGRANLLRKALQSSNPIKNLKGGEIKHALDLCLSCKACKGECPASVDMAKLKSEYLFQTRTFLSHIKLWHVRKLGFILKAGSKAPGVFNFLQSSFIINFILGFEKKPPQLEKESLAIYWKKNRPIRNDHSITVWVVVDIFTQYYDVNIGKSLFGFLKECNVNIEVVYSKDSISALVSNGLLNEAKKSIELMLSQLIDVAKNDLIVGIEPSETLVWRDEVKSLISKKSPNILLFEELVLKLKQLNKLPKFNAINSKVWVHEHCHQKVLADTSNLIEALELIPEIQIKVIKSGCCGMAGYFGYKHLKISKKIAHNSLNDYISKIENQDILIATGTSCRRQILDVFTIQTQHLPQLFAKSVR
jgi:FAD/FMN-containing dehydrogenase/Fe-S oxidoreductase